MTIWFRAEGREPERVETCAKKDAGYLVREYRLAFGLNPGQHRHGKDKLWAGKKTDEPKE